VARQAFGCKMATQGTGYILKGKEHDQTESSVQTGI
jgi:hypothetical protein